MRSILVTKQTVGYLYSLEELIPLKEIALFREGNE